MHQLTAKDDQKDENLIQSGKRLTIETIDTFTQLIRKGLAEASTVIIEFEANVEVDITALQILCSACKAASLAGKKLLPNGPLPGSLQQLVVTAGFPGTDECRIGNTACFLKLGGAR